MDLNSLFSDVTIGKDTSGYLKLSFEGIAVGTTAGKWFVEREGHLLDVTGLTLDGADKLIYKIPVRELQPGDLIVTAEKPSFSALFVKEVLEEGNVIRGINPERAEDVTYVPPENLLKLRLFMKVVSLFNLGDGEMSNNALLPLILLNANTSSGAGDDHLKTLLLFEAMGSDNQLDPSLVPLLLLDGNKGDSLEMLLLLRMLDDGSGGLGGLFGPTRQRSYRRPGVPTAGARPKVSSSPEGK